MRTTLIFSVLDQMALSAFNFLLALTLIRYWNDKPEVFGIYSVVMAGLLTLTSVQNALVLGHLTVLRPKARDPENEAALLSMFWTVNAVVTIAAMLVAYIVTTTSTPPSANGQAFALATSLYIGAALIREYTRTYHFSTLEVTSVLAIDAASLVFSAIAIVAVWHYVPPLTLNTLFLILASGQIIASIPSILKRLRHFQLSFSQEAQHLYRDVWRQQASWALLGVISTEFQNRGYVFVVALIFGATQVALLQAAALLMRPVQLLTQAWGKPARAILAGHFANGRRAKAREFTLKSLAVLMAIFVCFLAVLAIGWPYIKTYVFGSRFSDIETIIVLWCISTAVATLAGVLSVEAQSLIKFRELSFASIVGAMICAAVLGGAVIVGNFRWSVLAVIAGQVSVLIIVARILARSSDVPPSLTNESMLATQIAPTPSTAADEGRV